MEAVRDLVIGVRDGEAGFALPQEAILSKIGIVGMSGSGKTNAARKLAEAMLDAGQHIGVFDPTGAWWGLRSSADGLSAGFSVVVFGGKHADVPLRADSGTMLARSFLKERFNAIFDMSMLNDAEIRRFTTDFLNVVNLNNKHPVHLFLDEFDIICPQAKGANSEDARAAVNTTVRRTRIKGIGVTMITQNPQDADKSVLNMADVVIAMRTQGSQAGDAIKKWMGRNASSAIVAEITSTLPSLPTGSGWVWAPQIDHLGVEQFLLCKTYDSGKTPKLGEKLIPPKVLAKVDIASLGAKIEAEVQEAKENDVAYLKEKIRKLEAQPKSTDDPERVMELLQQLAELQDKANKAAELEAQVQGYRARENNFLGLLKGIVPTLQRLLESVDQGAYPELKISSIPSPPIAAVERKVYATPTESYVVKANGLPSPQQKILDSLAMLLSVDIPKPDRVQVALFAGYSHPNSGGFARPVAELKESGLIESASGAITLTQSGRDAANHPKRMITNRDLHERLQTLMGASEWKMLKALIDHYPTVLHRTKLAELCGYSHPNSGGFARPVSRLQKLGFAESPHSGYIVGSKLLFLGGHK